MVDERVGRENVGMRQSVFRCNRHNTELLKCVFGILNPILFYEAGRISIFKED